MGIREYVEVCPTRTCDTACWRHRSGLTDGKRAGITVIPASTRSVVKNVKRWSQLRSGKAPAFCE
jgi:hypothetical protein